MKDNMEQPTKTKLKPLRDIDAVARTQFLKAFVWLFGPFVVLGFWAGVQVGGMLGAAIGLFVAGAGSVVASHLIMFVLERSGMRIAAMFYGGRHTAKSPVELLANEISMVKFRRMRGEYGVALEIVNGILKVDPAYPEGLLLKAQTLWEGFGNATAARGYLRRLVEDTGSEQTSIHTWASTLYDELEGKEDSMVGMDGK